MWPNESISEHAARMQCKKNLRKELKFPSIPFSNNDSPHILSSNTHPRLHPILLSVFNKSCFWY